MTETMILGLSGLFLISFLGNGPIPLPLTATVLWLGQFHFPLLVVAVSTLGATLGWIILAKNLKGWLNENPKTVEKIPESYRQFFLRNTGLWLFVLNAFPFPLDFMRFLALLNHYPPNRLLLILTLARLCRNTLLVLIGAALVKQQVILWLLMALLITIPLLVGGWLNRGKNREASPAALERKHRPRARDSVSKL